MRITCREECKCGGKFSVCSSRSRFKYCLHIFCTISMSSQSSSRQINLVLCVDCGLRTSESISQNDPLGSYAHNRNASHRQRNVCGIGSVAQPLQENTRSRIIGQRAFTSPWSD